MRNLFILGFLAIVVATSAYAYTTGDWLCTSGACTLGATTATSTQIIGGVESLSVGASNDTVTLTVDGTDTAVFLGADAASPSNTAFDTTGAGTVTLGSADVTAVIATTDGASLNLEGTTAETLTLTATSTNTAVFQGADATGIANTAFDTTGAGSIVVGSADVLAVTVTSDGGSVVLDGTVVAPVALVELTDGALTANTVHLATTAADYVLPACATATGDWVTVIVRDISEVVSLVPASGDTIHAPGTTTVLGADDELDSAGSDDDDGDFITLVCAEANDWYATAMGFQWVDGGTS